MRAYAYSTLTEIAEDYESSLARFNAAYQTDPNFFFRPDLAQPKTLMGVIRGSTGEGAPQNIAKAFLDMKKRVHWDVPMFDIPAAEKWCTQHKPKCEE